MIDIGNIGKTGVDDGGRPVYKYERYEPSNSIQARTMRTANKEIFLATFLTGRGQANVMVAETKQATVVAAEAGAIRAVRNAHLAGGVHPETKVPFNTQGYPDFKAAGVVKTEVAITPTGTRPGDFRAANKAAGLKKTPKGYTWHHHEDGRTMQLVPTEIHRKTGHDGGFKETRMEVK